MRVIYSSNNSGGNWWLDDADWKKLEAAGWRVEWGGQYHCHSPISWHPMPEGDPQPHDDPKDCRGHRRAESAELSEPYRWLGALAREASIECESEAVAIAKWEHVTGQNASDEGCRCCGSPHNFMEERSR